MTAARSSAWVPFRSSLPTQYTNLPMDAIRRNLFALEVAANLGAIVPFLGGSTLPVAVSVVPGWSYTNSFTRGETVPGTVTRPRASYWYTGTGNKRIWLKAEYTYSSNNITKIALYYSSDNEASYVPLLDSDGNYVLTFVYTGNPVASTSWGNVP